MENMEGKQLEQQTANRTLLEMYKVADENHRFYVDKRFTIVSLYFPGVTLVLSGVFALGDPLFRVPVCILGVALTLFLYALENRNWILSNTCSHNCSWIGKQINGQYNLHVQLEQSYSGPLPIGATILDPLVRRIARTQHKAVSVITIFLLVYWIAIAIIFSAAFV